jgi:alpha-L-fucosidase
VHSLLEGNSNIEKVYHVNARYVWPLYSWPPVAGVCQIYAAQDADFMKLDRRSLLQILGAASLGSLTGPSAKAFPALPPHEIDPALAAAKPRIDGPFEPTWESLRDRYRAPEWLRQAKLGIFIHWGLYSIPAHGNEWYAKHMYTSDVAWHTEHYGAPDKFGYKDFIPLFTVKNFDAEAWAALFREAGARYVVPVAEHHDGFAMWNSDLTPWCAGKMGPKRDLIGELAQAVRKQNLIFGCSFHRMEHHTFMYPAAGVVNDQFDPRFADFYGPPTPGEMNDGEASAAFQEDWLARTQELIDKYRPQILYFDNGVNSRNYDGVKLRCAAHYYNRALEWKQQATLATKDLAYLAGSVPDFEKSQRAPEWSYPGTWLVDDTIGTNSWGYTTGMRCRPVEQILTELVDICSKGGGLLLNISPMGDGSIPGEQQAVLRQMGAWLAVHGEAIYGSQAWRVYGEGPQVPAEPPPTWKGGSTAAPSPLKPLRAPAPTTQDFRFTTNDGALYAFGLVWPETYVAALHSLRKQDARVERVSLIGRSGALEFKQDETALHVQLPEAKPALAGPYVLKIEGSQSLGVA